MRAKRDSNSHSIVLQTISLTNLDIRSYLNIIFVIDSREDINNRNINIPIIAIIYLIFNFFIVLNLKKEELLLLILASWKEISHLENYLLTISL